MVNWWCYADLSMPEGFNAMMTPWISLAEAARIVGRGPRATRVLLHAKGARCLSARGIATRWLRADVERVAGGEAPHQEAPALEVGS